MKHVLGLIAEAARSSRSQPVASALTILMVAAMLVSVMLTTGRTVGAEQQIVGSIDSAGTRSIIVRAEPDAGVDASVLDRLSAIDGIESAVALSAATDATNSAVTDGMKVPVRFVYSDALHILRIPLAAGAGTGVAVASDEAMRLLGMPDGAGLLTTSDGAGWGVTRGLEVPEALRQFEPLVVIPGDHSTSVSPVSVLVVVATEPGLVSPVAEAVASVVAAEDPSKVTVQTSEALAQLRDLVQGQLASFSRGLVLAVLALAGLLVAAILYGLVMLRRKDFGRRRALGASRSYIVALLLWQTCILATGGVALGSVIATAILSAMGDPRPGVQFTLAVGVLAVATATGAATAPAIAASKRQPIAELRVP